MIIHCLLLPDINLILGQRLLQSLVLTLCLHAYHALYPGSAFVILQGMPIPENKKWCIITPGTG